MTVTAPSGKETPTELQKLLNLMTAPPTPPPQPKPQPTLTVGQAPPPAHASKAEEDGWDTPEPTKAPQLVHATLDAFFTKVIRPLYVRKVSGRGTYRWSARWWESREATARLEALWRSWEHQRHDPAMGMITWFREADYHMQLLMSPEGPFAQSKDETQTGEMLPHTDPPPGLFTPVQAQEEGA